MGLSNNRAWANTGDGIGCLLPSCFPIKLPDIPCLPFCPTKCPSPTPEQPVPTPTREVPGEPSPTLPPAVGGNGDGGGGGSQGGAEAPHCGSQTPAAPRLKSVNKIKTNEVELVWDPVELATHYTISYGPASHNYLYGVSNTGKVTSFKVGALGAGNYCFSIRAVNDCAPSDPSNEICTGGITGEVLGAKVLGATGSFSLWLSQALVIIAVICGIQGVRNCMFSQKKVWL